MCVSVFLCVSACTHVHGMPSMARSPGAAVTGDPEPPHEDNWDTGNPEPPHEDNGKQTLVLCKSSGCLNC